MTTVVTLGLLESDTYIVEDMKDPDGNTYVNQKYFKKFDMIAECNIYYHKGEDPYAPKVPYKFVIIDYTDKMGIDIVKE